MRRSTTTAAAAAPARPLLVGTAGSSALAAGSNSGSGSGDVTVTNTETIQARLSATRCLQKASTTTDNVHRRGASPARTWQGQACTNLARFGGYRGRADPTSPSRRSAVGSWPPRHAVSTYDRDLHADRRGRVHARRRARAARRRPSSTDSSTLGVHYTVTNTTGKTQDVTYDDGTGTEATASAETVVPMIRPEPSPSSRRPSPTCSPTRPASPATATARASRSR